MGTRQKTRSPSESHSQVLHGAAVRQLRTPPPASATAAHQHGGKLELPSEGQTSEDNIPALPESSPKRVQIKLGRVKKKSQYPGFVQAKGDSATGRDLAVKMRIGIFFFNMFIHVVASGNSCFYSAGSINAGWEAEQGLGTGT